MHQHCSFVSAFVVYLKPAPTDSTSEDDSSVLIAINEAINVGLSRIPNTTTDSQYLVAAICCLRVDSPPQDYP